MAYRGADVELGIGVAVRGWEVEDVPCKLCRRSVTPHPIADIYTLFDCGWVCDECAIAHDPELFRLLERLRAVAGDTLVRQISDYQCLEGHCPKCGGQLDLDFVESNNGWAIVPSDDDVPWCEQCVTRFASEEVREVLAAIGQSP